MSAGIQAKTFAGIREAFGVLWPEPQLSYSHEQRTWITGCPREMAGIELHPQRAWLYKSGGSGRRSPNASRMSAGIQAKTFAGIREAFGVLWPEPQLLYSHEQRTWITGCPREMTDIELHLQRTWLYESGGSGRRTPNASRMSAGIQAKTFAGIREAFGVLWPEPQLLYSHEQRTWSTGCPREMAGIELHPQRAWLYESGGLGRRSPNASRRGCTLLV